MIGNGIRRLQVTAGSLAAGYGVIFAMTAELREEYRFSSTLIGLIVGTGFFASFAAQITLAPLADRGHARALLLGGLCANIVGLLLMAWASTAIPFVVGRIAMGLGVGAAYPAIRRSVAVIDPVNVGKNMGGLNSFDVAGFLVGPAIAATLVPTFGIRWPFIVAAVISALTIPTTWRSPFGAAATVKGPRLAVGLLRHNWMQASCLYAMAFFIMIGTFDAIWALRIKDIGAPNLYVTIGIIVFASPMLILGERGGAFVGRRGPFRTGFVGLAAGAGFLSLYGLIDRAPLLILIGIVHATNDGITAASVPVAVSLTAPPEQQAGAQGLAGAAQTLIGGCAAVGGGWVYEHLGPVATYVGASSMMLVLISLGWWRAGEYRSRRIDGVVGSLDEQTVVAA